jgi:hypothetical protein
VPFEFEGRTPAGEWVTLSRRPAIDGHSNQDLRLAAAQALRRAGFQYILAPTGSEGNSPIGNAVLGHEAKWGMELAGSAGRFCLFRIK